MIKIIRAIDTVFMKSLDWATSSKGACYILSILIWVFIILNPPKDLQGWLLIIVSVFYQGVALPGIGAQSKVEGQETRKLLSEMHDAVMQEMSDVKDMHQEGLEEITAIKEMHDVTQQEVTAVQEMLTVIRKTQKDGGNING